MGANPNNKGSGGEREVKNILLAHGYQAECTGKWKKLDVWFIFRGVKQFLEVKRRKKAWTQIYKAFSEGAWFVGREDHGVWFIAMPLLEYLNQQKPPSNTGQPMSPSPMVGDVIPAWILPTTEPTQL